MFGTISKKRETSNILKAYPEINEIYTETDFTFEKDYINVYLLSNVTFDVVKLLYELNDIFPLGARVYIAKSNLDIMLQDKKIIWRKGRWYL